MENLIKIQNELKVPKGNFNIFGKYKYRSAEDILEAIKPILLKYNAALTLSDEIVLIGTKVFLKATAKLNETFCYGYAELAEHKGMSAEQATGTASSYARKYALNGLFLIDETEQDADNDNKKQSALIVDVESAKAKLIVAKDLDNLKSLFTSLSKDEQAHKDVIVLKDKLKHEFSNTKP